MIPYPSSGSHILAFDLHNELMNSFRLPVDRKMDAFAGLAVLGESLAWLDIDHRLGHCKVHVMEQYGVAESWVKRFRIDLVCDHFLYLKRDGELFITVQERQLKVYEIESGRLRILLKVLTTVIFVDTSVESLVLLYLA